MAIFASLFNGAKILNECFPLRTKFLLVECDFVAQESKQEVTKIISFVKLAKKLDYIPVTTFKETQS